MICQATRDVEIIIQTPPKMSPQHIQQAATKYLMIRHATTPPGPVVEGLANDQDEAQAIEPEITFCYPQQQILGEGRSKTGQSQWKKNYGLESGADQTNYVFVRYFDFAPKLCLHSMKRVSHRSVCFGCFWRRYEL